MAITFITLISVAITFITLISLANRLIHSHHHHHHQQYVTHAPFPFPSIDSQVFAATARLTSLDLSHNRLSEVTDMMFSRLELSLVELDVSYNNVRAIKGLALQHLQHLRRLSLARNPLTALTDVQFPQHLRSLDLSHCALTIIDHCQLSGLPDLSFIGLAGNDLQVKGLGAGRWKGWGGG